MEIDKVKLIATRFWSFTDFLTRRQHMDNSNGTNRNRKLFGEIVALRRGTKENFIFNGSFYEAIGPILVMAECFSVMPVINVKGKSPNDLYYSWKSLRSTYSIVVMLATFAITALITYWTLSQDLKFDNIVPVVFYVSNSITRVFFLLLAYKWPKLMQYWQEVEDKLPPFETQEEKAVLAYKIKMTSIVVMLLSMCLYQLHVLDYFVMELNQIFVYFKYSPYLAFAAKLLNILSTFMWTYMDLFVMVISLGISAQFRKINTELMKNKGKAMPESYWIENRSNYRNVCRLCESIDDAIGPITIVSFANNLYFVCVQLLRSLNPMPSIAHAVYFWFSLTFLISRTLAVSLYSADINDESKKPIRAFRSCPEESWCMEVKRFYYEVSNDVVALSGMRFFHLTRNLVLSVAGTIVTYELVLIQFHHVDHEAGTC